MNLHHDERRHRLRLQFGQLGAHELRQFLHLAKHLLEVRLHAVAPRLLHRRLHLDRPVVLRHREHHHRRVAQHKVAALGGLVLSDALLGDRAHTLAHHGFDLAHPDLDRAARVQRIEEGHLKREERGEPWGCARVGALSETRRVGTCSFSAETISDISCSAPLIVIVCTASKHLRRWGCTADGSFV